MKFEKSCGAVCVREVGERRQVLLVRHMAGGGWAFPKGHTEGGESEAATALREVLEETGVRLVLLPGFRYVTSYSPVAGTLKRVVYFAARPATAAPPTPQPGEIREARFVEVDEALRRLAHPGDKRLLRRVLRMLQARREAPEARPRPPRRRHKMVK